MAMSPQDHRRDTVMRLASWCQGNGMHPEMVSALRGLAEPMPVQATETEQLARDVFVALNASVTSTASVRFHLIRAEYSFLAAEAFLAERDRRRGRQ